MASPEVSPGPTVVRCAIYTRKSTEEGLEQQFNSLDAQREAAEAYILSQKTAGWLALPARYDDGGFSGAHLDRPALAQLLAQIEAGRIDCVVIYKVDRLSRSLLDFARIMGIFEKHNVSFVSVTQQFNTTVPVGRLTLNILLSFAQFEREIIGERTRDKKAAARKKGKWTGGYIPLGYDLDAAAGKLVVNRIEAARVRAIFRVFAKCHSIDATLADVNRRRWRTKTWILQNGKKREGKAFTKSSLVRLLGNELYIGHVRYQDKMYGGEQRAIMDQRLWKQVEAKLPTQKTEPWRSTANQHGALLHGILQCAECRAPMRCTYTKNGDRRYRYYVCRSIGPGSSCRNRVSAESLEASVMKQLQASAPGSTGVLKLVHAYSRSRSLDRADLIRLTREVIARVCYDRRSSEVTICMHDKKDGRGKAK